jgi:hypothetical protein
MGWKHAVLHVHANILEEHVVFIITANASTVRNVSRLHRQANHLPCNLLTYLDNTLQHTHFNSEDEGTTHSSESLVSNYTI